jgi:hypothetical protein
MRKSPLEHIDDECFRMWGVEGNFWEINEQLIAEYLGWA